MKEESCSKKMFGFCYHFYDFTVLAYVYIFPPPILTSAGFGVFVTRKSDMFQN